MQFTNDMLDKLPDLKVLQFAGTGVSNLGPLLDALEEQVVVMRLMTAVSRSSAADGVGVAIGSETHSEELANASVVSSAYGVGTTDDSASDERLLAFVGSIGPTHMNYSATMAAVKADRKSVV